MLKNKRGRPPSLKVAAAGAAMYTHNIPYEVYIAYTEQCPQLQAARRSLGIVVGAVVGLVAGR